MQKTKDKKEIAPAISFNFNFKKTPTMGAFLFGFVQLYNTFITKI